MNVNYYKFLLIVLIITGAATARDSTAIDFSKIKYEISGVLQKSGKTVTVLRMPQTLSVEQVVQQVNWYYHNLDPDERTKETIMIYPLFVPLSAEPAARAKYFQDSARVELLNWARVSRPPAPLPEEKALFNRLMEFYFRESGGFGEIEDSVFSRFARENKIETAYLKKLYQDIILWQKSD